MKNYLILTSSAEHFEKKLQKGGFEVILPDLNREKKKYFPDGEVYVRLSGVKEMRQKRAIIVHAGAPKPNDGLVELELVLQILKDNNIRPEIFFTYFPYGQQDRIFEEGETNVAENLIKKLVGYYAVKKIYAVDPHFAQMNWLKSYPLTTISATSFLKEKVKRDFGENVLFLATDKGGQRRFKIAGFDKVRENSYRVELKLSEKLIDLIKGRVVCLVDDLIETGNTLLRAAELSKKYGAKKVICLTSHCLLKEGVEKARKKFAKVYLTNTIYRPEFSQIDISQIILKAIK